MIENPSLLASSLQHDAISKLVGDAQRGMANTAFWESVNGQWELTFEDAPLQLGLDP